MVQGEYVKTSGPFFSHLDQQTDDPENRSGGTLNFCPTCLIFIDKFRNKVEGVGSKRRVGNCPPMLNTPSILGHNVAIFTNFLHFQIVQTLKYYSKNLAAAIV